jgi:hypothetical protein
MCHGIIDLVNTHARIAMFYGLVGWALFVGPFLIAIWSAFKKVRVSAGTDPDAALMGATLIACLFGFLLMMAMGGYSERLSYLVLGISAGFIHLRSTTGVVEATQAIGSRTVLRAAQFKGAGRL